MAPRPHPAPPAPHFYAEDEAIFEVALHEPGHTPAVPERLIQEIWRLRRFDAAGLQTTTGEPVTVVDPGRWNGDAGPDFGSACVRIGGTEWRGSVEVHATSSGWFEHRHHTDARYNSVVLHVVLQADVWTGGLHRADGSRLPEVVLLPRLDAPLRGLLYAFHTRPPSDLPCAAGWGRVPDGVRAPWLEQLAHERLQARRRQLGSACRSEAELEQQLYEQLFTGLGYAKNDEAMASLSRRIPLALARTLPDPLDLEALFFGVAGLLPSPADLLDTDRATADRAVELRDRFERMQHRLERPCMERTSWQFFRLRPANFPTLRIAQGVALLAAPEGLLRRDPLGRLREAALAAQPVRALRRVLRARPASFWETHLRLDRSTKPRDPALGRERIDALLVNAVVPVLLLLAERRHDAALAEQVPALLRTLPADPDEVTRRFAALGTSAASAFDAQGLHQLFRTRCRAHRCLSCAVGMHLLQGGCETPSPPASTREGPAVLS